MTKLGKTLDSLWRLAFVALSVSSLGQQLNAQYRLSTFETVQPVYSARKHIIYSLDALLYELHTLSFLLTPSLFILLCRCATQFQFARVRELDGRRALSFWLALVVLVNVGGVWTHAAAGASDGAKGIVLDFVGMGRRPSKLQLLLLDGTIMFLQAVLTTISYETSLSLAMPTDIPDPLLPASTTSSTPPSPTITDLTSETAPFIPYSSPRTSSTASPPITYPPTRALTPPISSSSLADPSFLPKATPTDSLPPPIPIIDLSLRHVAHRLTSPVPEPPARADGGLDGEDDELAVLRLPLPNTTSVRLAQTLRLLAQARQRRRERERQEARRPRGATDGESRHSGAAEGDARRGRIPGAIEEEEED